MATAVLVACAARKPETAASSPPVSMERGYVDLQPGWRIRVVTPVTKSGRFTVVTSSPEAHGNVLSLKADSDFVGYEISYYAVQGRPGGGIPIRFTSATITSAGKKSGHGAPLVRLFELPADARYARLLFLTRVSPADHDQGIVAAATRQGLEDVTARVEADPEQSCTVAGQEFCAWIPLGIAVQPEKRDAHTSQAWRPAT